MSGLVWRLIIFKLLNLFGVSGQPGVKVLTYIYTYIYIYWRIRVPL